MRLRVSTIALAVAATLPSLASAVDFSYSGFSTAGYAQLDTDQAQVGYLGQDAGIDSDGTMAADSKLGVQLSAKFNDMFSATVQGVAYADTTAHWKPHLDWAYVRFQPVSRLSARAGYMRTPTFMYSDSVFVGYANTWIRPPMEVYNLAPAFQLRGVDLTWRDSIGEVNFSVQPYFGDSKLKIGEAEKTLNIPAWSGIAVSGQYRSFMARAGYASIETDGMDIGLGALIDPLKAAAAAFNCAACAKDAQHLDLDGTVLKILDLGAQYDNGTDIAMVEYGHRSSSSYVIRGMYAAYATYGHRFGNFTPYATYAIARLNGRETSEIPAVGPLAGLSNVVTSTLAERFNNDQDTWSIGLRYEVPAFSVLSGAVAKLQYDSIDAKGGRGLFVAPQPGFDGTAGMISASFDFIF